MTDELLSVIVPIYNVGMFLPHCIESIIKQTYAKLEIILVDDGSTDSSGKIADDYARMDQRIKVIHKRNGGLISARYAGIRNAHGKYAAFVDGDDWIAPDMYETLMDIMGNYGVDLITSGCFRYFSEGVKSVSFDKFIEPGLYGVEQIQTKIIPIMLWDERSNIWSLDPSTCFKIYKKELLLPVLERLKEETFYYGEDSAITYPYVLKINSMFCTNEVFYFHRQRLGHQVQPYFISDDFFGKLTALYYYLHKEFKRHALSNVLLKQLDHFFADSARYKQLKYGMLKSVREDYYLFPFDQVSAGSKFVIYGAGRVGTDYREQIEKLQYGKPVLWVDKNHKSLGAGISDPDGIAGFGADYIVIAAAKDEMAEEIRNRLLQMGIQSEKIIHKIRKCR